jgi:uncharacterized protein involved in exopolysaccharide biosynthesis
MIDWQGPTQGGPTGVRGFVGFVRRRKYLILAPTVLIAGLAWTIAAATPPRFTATAALALDVRKVQIVEHEVVSRLPQESPVLRTELDVIRSRSLGEGVVDRLGLTSDPEVLREAGAAHSLWGGCGRHFSTHLRPPFPW